MPLCQCKMKSLYKFILEFHEHYLVHFCRIKNNNRNLRNIFCFQHCLIIKLVYSSSPLSRQISVLLNRKFLLPSHNMCVSHWCYKTLEADAGCVCHQLRLKKRTSIQVAQNQNHRNRRRYNEEYGKKIIMCIIRITAKISK